MQSPGYKKKNVEPVDAVGNGIPEAIEFVVRVNSIIQQIVISSA